ncbi:MULTISPECIES: hypothetical protein [unclassified Streptomyces]|uniref:hypothetical protein n=1 Tax=unclassified Streptomyces TaxID=2593676 RepID=UPI0022567916|nr:MULTISPECIES: hypothetical protein [unclassified Streptomyces]MCX5328766.1 hypothetical protein [Streptomyces sp. NBC_00140]MCX5358174.1 hypothetical protein [Streptomyces sp. NBC_00124]
MDSWRAVDMLPDHMADAFAAWLEGRDHIRTVLDDVLLIWKAKPAGMNVDCSIDIHLLYGSSRP